MYKVAKPRIVKFKKASKLGELKETHNRQEDHFASILVDLKSKIEFVKS